jgi:hypothetical protein
MQHILEDGGNNPSDYLKIRFPSYIRVRTILTPEYKASEESNLAQ